MQRNSSLPMRAAGGRPSPIGSVAILSCGCDLTSRAPDLPEGADALSGSFPIFPTILCAQSPMARQDPRLVARSSSVSPAIPSRSGVEG